MTSADFIALDEANDAVDRSTYALHALIEEAARSGASDLLLLADQHHTTIAIRRWGLVERLGEVEPAIGRHYVSAVKVMAEMDIAERRRPLDGRISLQIDGQPIDIRVNTLPTLHGEDATLRLLDPRQEVRTLDQLGMADADRERIADLLANPSGLILVSGPTGAGKTTTLYACLAELNDGTRKINTLEDPIEYSLEGVRQSQVNEAIDLDFARLLASVLRQAPDVVMVGEVRDVETATTAVRAANSGHLVFATLHAPTAAGAVQSMLALGVAPHFLASSLLGVVAQRLVRVLCPHCRQKHELPELTSAFESVAHLLPNDMGRGIHCSQGCHCCGDSGYAGRGGLFEIMSATKATRGLIASQAARDEIHAQAVEDGLVDFRSAAIVALAEGRTSIEEVVRVIPTDLLDVHG
ncbi:GspE/PulE family protein [Aeoliella sp. ICT_H6.2]|uniref:GspE/PulE family protein n=1 Tax=Aeoliella straminimaris TaxID=2954799 RepID=A0A9X2FG16_9BACT|nr:GspE/PulE family protein [Aeoliella straminimaris]